MAKLSDGGQLLMVSCPATLFMAKEVIMFPKQRQFVRYEISAECVNTSLLSAVQTFMQLMRRLDS